MTLEREPLVLVVATGIDTLTSLCPALEKEGCQVATRRRAAEGLKYAADHQPEFAIVGGDGVDRPDPELERRIRELSPRTRILSLHRVDARSLEQLVRAIRPVA